MCYVTVFQPQNTKLYDGGKEVIRALNDFLARRTRRDGISLIEMSGILTRWEGYGMEQWKEIFRMTTFILEMIINQMGLGTYKQFPVKNESVALEQSVAKSCNDAED